MQWLDLMDAWVACKRRLVCDTKPNDSTFELIDMQASLDTLVLFAKQFFKCIQRDVELFTISVEEPINEPMIENSLNEIQWEKNQKNIMMFSLQIYLAYH